MNPVDPPRLVILLSGRGTNYAALQAAASEGWLGARIAGVISDRAEADGLALAQSHGVDTVCVERVRHRNRAEFEASLETVLTGFAPDLIVLAGFMRVLSTHFVDHFKGRMINIHPSLLPRHRGLGTHQRALDAGDTEHGASVHFVTPELDGGPVISQVRMAVRADDTATTLAERLLPLEHRLLPATMALLARTPVELRNDEILLKHETLDKPLQLACDLDDRGRLKSVAERG